MLNGMDRFSALYLTSERKRIGLVSEKGMVGWSVTHTNSICNVNIHTRFEQLALTM